MNKNKLFSNTAFQLGLIILSGTILLSPTDGLAKTDIGSQPEMITSIKKEPEKVTPFQIQQQAEKFIADLSTFEGRVDNILQSLLTIPYEKRQYYFPYLHEEAIMPHKIKSHPQIIVWKGKKPTVIAPHLQEYAKKYLDDLPAIFYHFLDPDFYEQPQSVENTVKPDLLNINTPQMRTKSILEIANYAVRDFRQSYTLSPKVQKDFYKTTITSKEVKQFMETFAQLVPYIDAYPYNEYIPSDLRQGIVGDLAHALANPFTTWIKNVRQTTAAPELEEFMKINGWKNADEFAQKADQILRAVRVSRMSLIKAIGYSNMRLQYPIEKGKPLTEIQNFLMMYEAHPGDALFMAPYAEDIKKIVDANNFIRIGLPIRID